MSGGTHSDTGDAPELSSAIAFCNRIAKSKTLADALLTDTARAYVADRMPAGAAPAELTAEHLDASHNTASRDNAKKRLAEGTPERPHSVFNVGVFGEGTDAPSLSAVAFLEPRRSPVDVVQAVGRAMRLNADKELGYIICPVVVPVNADAETWLAQSRPDEGWEVLGQVLQALRAHDSRIEVELADLMSVYLPSEADEAGPETATHVAVVAHGSDRITHRLHRSRGLYAAEDAAEAVADGSKTPKQAGLEPLPADASAWDAHTEPTQIVTAKPLPDGGVEVRSDTIQRDKPAAASLELGPVSIPKSKRHASNMVNNKPSPGGGPPPGRVQPTKAERAEQRRLRRQRRKEQREKAMQGTLAKVDEATGHQIGVNLLERSGLTADRVKRDLNLLEAAVAEASRHLRDDGLTAALDTHFGLDHLAPEKRKGQADGCTIAALLWMNAAMLHQRIAAGGWLSGIDTLAAVKSAVDPPNKVKQNWERITRRDFLPVVEPAREAVYAVEDTAKTAGMERALRHLASEAERIAETYADMGADHAGPLFNKVMGNQASDGAYFTRPPAATITARLALDACEPRRNGGRPQDWADPGTWRAHKAVDLACGSGTLLVALLTDMKRRARRDGADAEQLARLQKVVVEEVIKGLDINPVSLQLAATQLTAGNSDIKYHRMGLYRMPYGPTGDPVVPTAAGTLELLADDEILPKEQTEMFASGGEGSVVRASLDDSEVEQAAKAAAGARIAIMNPPFTERERMGQKFPKRTQKLLRGRVDGLEDGLVAADPGLDGFVTRRALRPMFVALAERCVDTTDGVLAMVAPTVSLANHSGAQERRVLADRFDLHTVLTCHQPGNINQSQNTAINESTLVMRRRDGAAPAARFVSLDRFPSDDNEAADLFAAMDKTTSGTLPGGWGEVSQWPADRVRQGDWTAAIWRSPELAEAAARLAGHEALQPMDASGVACHLTRPSLATAHRRSTASAPGAFPILKSKGADGQLRIEAVPDEHWAHNKPGPSPTLAKAAHLLVTAGQRTSTGRLTAVASSTRYVGHGWMTVVGLTVKQAKAAAVFLNSTPGRLLLMRNPGRALDFPNYTPAIVNALPVPDLADPAIVKRLAVCWAATRHTTVPQYRDGECDIRRLWDEAVCEALGWDQDETARLRHLLHREPHVSGYGRGQHQDATD